MKTGALIIFGVLAVAANLLLPQNVQVYKACCLDENGAVRAASDMPCKQGRTGAVRLEGPDCCAPTTYELRPSPPSALLVSAAPRVPLAQDAGLGVAQPVRIQAVCQAPSLPHTYYDTGPPRPDPLALHMRLNL
jgi:hypothetical protein